MEKLTETGYTLSFYIDYDDARPITVDSIEIPISREEYEAIKALLRPNYYDMPDSVQVRIDEAFSEWGEDRDGGYSIGGLDVWKG